jgi:hypothetical protein
MKKSEFEQKLNEIKQTGEFPHFDSLEFTFEQSFIIKEMLNKFVENYFNKQIRQRIIKTT